MPCSNLKIIFKRQTERLPFFLCNVLVTSIGIKYIIDKLYSGEERENTKAVVGLKPSGDLTKEAANAQLLDEPQNLLDPVAWTMMERQAKMMDEKTMPHIFRQLLSGGCVKESDVLQTRDGFQLLYKSLSNILSENNIIDFPNSEGKRLPCSKFYDDWFLYAVPNEADHTYSLLKLREQEYDAADGSPADGDTPGVTISFISFACERLLACLAEPSDENRRRLDGEINRVVARRGQTHHKNLKQYFLNPQSQGSYLVANLYTAHIAAFAKDGYLNLPEHYKKIVKQYQTHKNSKKLARLPDFIEELNRKAGYVLCDHEKLYIQNPEKPNQYEAAAILATHTGNTSVHSFAAEVEYHARFLTPLAKIKIPFFGRSVYASAIRADMSVGDAEFQGPTPFYQETSRIAKQQYMLHPDNVKEGL